MRKKRFVLSIFSLVMITVGSVDSLRNLPATALFGSHLIVLFILAALFFLVPTALASAELASGWPKQGGVYVWVKEAFGQRIGFFAIWLQWIENVIWYPTILAFVAGTIGYLIHPTLAANPYFLWAVIVACFWGGTWVNLRGIQSSALFANICTISGLLIPMAMIIAFGGAWIMGDNPVQIRFDWANIIPDWGLNGMWVSLTAIMLSFCGIEIATVHADEVDNPQHAFPRALSYSVVIIVLTLLLGSLAIAVVLPKSEISLVAGIMQSFDAFFKHYHTPWLMPLVAIMLVLGGLGGVNNWIIAPTAGLMVAGKDHNLPAFFLKKNKQGAPVTLLVTQALIVTVLSFLFIFMPSVNGSYWYLTALAAQLYMVMYGLMLLAAIVLRCRHPKHSASFRIPGGIGGVIGICGAGIVGVAVTFVVSFMPPNDIDVGNISHYVMALGTGLMLMCAPPFLSYAWMNRRGRMG